MATSETLTLNLVNPSELVASLKEQDNTDANYLASAIINKFVQELEYKNMLAVEDSLPAKTPYDTLVFNAPDYFDTARGSFPSTKKMNIRTLKPILEEAVKMLKHFQWDVSVAYDQVDGEETFNTITMRGLTKEEIEAKQQEALKQKQEIIAQQRKIREEEFAKIKEQAKNIGYNVNFTKEQTAKPEPRVDIDLAGRLGNAWLCQMALPF